MQVTITQRDIDLAAASSHPSHLHLFYNPIAVAYAREMVVDYCAVTVEKIHVASPSGIEYVQPLAPAARSALVEWIKSRYMRTGPLTVF